MVDSINHHLPLTVSSLYLRQRLRANAFWVNYVYTCLYGTKTSLLEFGFSKLRTGRTMIIHCSALGIWPLLRSQVLEKLLIRARGTRQNFLFLCTLMMVSQGKKVCYQPQFGCNSSPIASFCCFECCIACFYSSLHCKSSFKILIIWF